MTTVREQEDFPDRICDTCEKPINGMMNLHWGEKDFDLCIDCLSELYQKHVALSFHNGQKGHVYKKTPIPDEIRWTIWRRDNFTCQYCGSREKLSIDHIIPEANGGPMVETNLVTACKYCNSKKNARTPEEAGMELINDPRN